METHLDRTLSSERTQIDFMKAIFKNYKHIEFIAKEVHSRSDLMKFLDFARKDKQVATVHIVGHGKVSRNKCSLYLTMNEEIDLRKESNQKLFKNLNNRILFFSCCQIGSEVEIMQKILNYSKASAIFSYSDDIFDDQSFIIESLFYHLLIHGEPIKATYEKLKFTMDYLRIDDSEESLEHPLLVADFPD